MSKPKTRLASLFDSFVERLRIPAACSWPCLALVFAALLPGIGQAQELSELLSGKTHPLTMKLKDFTADWRRITVQGSGGVNGNISVNVSGNSSSATSQNNLTGAVGSSRAYVTRGQTVFMGGRPYLVAYHLPAIGLNLSMLLQAVATKTPPAAAALNEESTVPLSLLDLPSIGNLDDIQVFDLKAEITESESLVKMIANAIKSDSGKPAPAPSGPSKGEGTKPKPE